jgi:hypothetical protein
MKARMAVFLGYFMIKTILDSGQLGYILSLSVYGLMLSTIINRLIKERNIFNRIVVIYINISANEMGILMFCLRLFTLSAQRHYYL